MFNYWPIAVSLPPLLNNATNLATVPGALSKRINLTLAIGHNDIYTVPVGRKAVLFTCAYFSAGGSTSIFPEVKEVGGTYRRISQSVTANPFNTTASFGFVFEAGESVSLNASVGAQCNAFGILIDFPATAPWFTARLSTFINGYNTLYTAPAGKSVIVTQSGGNTPTYTNDGVGLVNMFYNTVKSGDAAGAGNQASTSVGVAAGTQRVGPPVAFTLEAGDKITINTDSNQAGQFVWQTMIEIP